LCASDVRAGNGLSLDRLEEYEFLKVNQAYNPSTQDAEEEDCKFKASLGYIARPCVKKQKTKPTNQTHKQKQVKIQRLD
jgi:hypothetical protein